MKCLEVYIVEDDNSKAARIIDVVSATAPHATCHTFRSYQSGLKAIESCPPSLVLLDMTLPTFDILPGVRDGRIRPLGGHDLMRKMARKDIPSKVILVTQLEMFGEGDATVTFADLSLRCLQEFPKFFLGAVQYRSSSEAWKEQLSSLIYSNFVVSEEQNGQSPNS